MYADQDIDIHIDIDIDNGAEMEIADLATGV